MAETSEEKCTCGYLKKIKAYFTSENPGQRVLRSLEYARQTMETKEEKCTCIDEVDYHICPYLQEIHGNEIIDENDLFCTCCDYCTEQCAMDI